MYLNRIQIATFLPFRAYNTDNQLITHSSGCTNLQTVKFGSGVESIIGDWVFKGCPNLNTIVVSSTTPPHVSYSAFEKMEVEPWDVELHVPKEAVEEYKKARYWKDFTIVED